MGSETRVTVIIGIFNADRFLSEAIESVLAQTYTAWELLLVDDGSTDGSAAIAQSYAERYALSVKYLDHPMHQRRGQGATRNLGLHHARGEFVAILDHDDVWLPNKLERQVAILDSVPEAAMVCGVTRYWHSWAGASPGQDVDYEQSPGVPANRIYYPPYLLKRTLSEEIIPPIPTDFMFRRERVHDLGGFEEAFIGALSLFEDQAFLAKVYASLPVFVSDECWDLYRIHPDQHCARVVRSGRKPEAEYFFLSWVAEYLEFQGLLDTELRAILDRRLWPHHHPLLSRAMRIKKRIAAKTGNLFNWDH